MIKIQNTGLQCNRGDARFILALMKRGNATRINGIRIEFDENGNFITWHGLKSDVCTPSLNNVLTYLFGDENDS